VWSVCGRSLVISAFEGRSHVSQMCCLTVLRSHQVDLVLCASFFILLCLNDVFAKADIPFRLCLRCKFLFGAPRAVVLPSCALGECVKRVAVNSTCVLFLVGLVLVRRNTVGQGNFSFQVVRFSVSVRYNIYLEIATPWARIYFACFRLP